MLRFQQHPYRHMDIFSHPRLSQNAPIAPDTQLQGGNMRYDLKWLASIAALGLSLGLADVALADASRAQPASNDQPPEQSPEIVVTGSRIPILITSTPAPITVVTAQELVNHSVVNLGDEVLQIPSVSVFPGSGSPESQQTGSSGGAGQYFINLFNLGQQRTLTLVDGQRFVSSSFGLNYAGASGDMVDIAELPTGLIEKVEVVQASGAAVYGSDAVAGVMNYVLKKNYEGISLDMQDGQTSRGDYPVNSERLIAGHNFWGGRANLTLSLEHSFSGSILAQNRPDTAIGFFTGAAVNPGSPNSPVYGFINHTFPEFNTTGVLYFSPNPYATGGPPGPVPPFYLTDANTGAPLQFSPQGALVPFNPGNYQQPAGSSGGDGLPFDQFTALYTQVERYNASVLGHVDITGHLEK